MYCRYVLTHILLISRFFEQRGIFRGRVESSTSLLFYRSTHGIVAQLPEYVSVVSEFE